MSLIVKIQFETFSNFVRGFPDSSVGKESTCSAGDPSSILGSGRSSGEEIARLLAPVFLGFSCGSAVKESTCNAGDLGLIPALGRSPGEGKATHSSILSWRIHQESEPIERLSFSLATSSTSSLARFLIPPL